MANQAKPTRLKKDMTREERIEAGLISRSVRVRLAKEEKKLQPVTEIKAHLKHARISSRKVQIVLDLIRGKSVIEARAILMYTPKAASELLIKLLDSATANAETHPKALWNRNDLYVAQCFATEGPTLKRIRPRAQGSANRINKRTSHVSIVLKEIEKN